MFFSLELILLSPPSLLNENNINLKKKNALWNLEYWGEGAGPE